jgi:hypothetical protein
MYAQINLALSVLAPFRSIHGLLLLCQVLTIILFWKNISSSSTMHFSIDILEIFHCNMSCGCSASNPPASCSQCLPCLRVIPWMNWICCVCIFAAHHALCLCYNHAGGRPITCYSGFYYYSCDSRLWAWPTISRTFYLNYYQSSSTIGTLLLQNCLVLSAPLHSPVVSPLDQSSQQYSSFLDQACVRFLPARQFESTNVLLPSQ